MGERFDQSPWNILSSANRENLPKAIEPLVNFIFDPTTGDSVEVKLRASTRVLLQEIVGNYNLKPAPESAISGLLDHIFSRSRFGNQAYEAGVKRSKNTDRNDLDRFDRLSKCHEIGDCGLPCQESTSLGGNNITSPNKIDHPARRDGIYRCNYSSSCTINKSTRTTKALSSDSDTLLMKNRKSVQAKSIFLKGDFSPSIPQAKMAQIREKFKTELDLRLPSAENEKRTAAVDFYFGRLFGQSSYDRLKSFLEEQLGSKGLRLPNVQNDKVERLKLMSESTIFTQNQRQMFASLRGWQSEKSSKSSVYDTIMVHFHRHQLHYQYSKTLNKAIEDQGAFQKIIEQYNKSDLSDYHHIDTQLGSGRGKVASTLVDLLMSLLAAGMAMDREDFEQSFNSLRQSFRVIDAHVNYFGPGVLVLMPEGTLEACQETLGTSVVGVSLNILEKLLGRDIYNICKATERYILDQLVRGDRPRELAILTNRKLNMLDALEPVNIRGFSVQDPIGFGPRPRKSCPRDPLIPIAVTNDEHTQANKVENRRKSQENLESPSKRHKK